MSGTEGVGAGEEGEGGRGILLLSQEISGVVMRTQVELMKRTRGNTTLKPPIAQRCTSTILLLSNSNFHCLLKERTKENALLSSGMKGTPFRNSVLADSTS